MARVGVDVGGTNTDFVLESEHGVYFHKVASTPRDQSEGVLKGLVELCDRVGIRPNEIELIVHGTTVATNITLERRRSGNDNNPKLSGYSPHWKA